MTAETLRPPIDVATMRPGPRDGRLAEILRVDHAGEYGAVQIYRGQAAVFRAAPGRSETARVIDDMAAGEARHLKTFDRLLTERRVRPTLLAPLWNAAGFGLGAATALLGERAAMACTAAVEEVIERHYANQAREIAEVEPALAATLTEFRDDELGHKSTAEAHGVDDGPGLALMKAVIRAGCRVAIRLSEKI